MIPRILIWLDTTNQTTFTQSLQLIGLTSNIQTPSVSAVVIGNISAEYQKQAASFGFEKIIQILSSDIPEIEINVYAQLITEWVKPIQPDLFIFPNSDYGRLLGASVSAALDLPFYPAIQTIHQQAEGYQLSRLTFGKKCKQILQVHSPFMLSANYKTENSNQFSDSSEIPLIKHQAANQPENLVEIIQKFQQTSHLPLEQARVIVTGGRGLLNNPTSAPADLTGEELDKWKVNHGFELLKTLAKQLNGTVGATRALVDAGFAPYEWQIGQTGKFVSPELYITCGVSGAIQHTIGMNNSRLIIAINKDPDAPIFKVANYGIIGDLYEILPTLIKDFA
ncbi:MAG: hypothetical protein CL609_20165 [Anaerolineaceae bacterium]|nr:hypothetical protein [Anaerolineaceae bacterium]